MNSNIPGENFKITKAQLKHILRYFKKEAITIDEVLKALDRDLVNPEDIAMQWYEKENNLDLPKNYFITKSGAVLNWNDDTVTAIKKHADDEHNVQLAFLIAYFQKHSGLSKEEANKYLRELKEFPDITILVETFKNVAANIASALGQALISMGRTLTGEQNEQ